MSCEPTTSRHGFHNYYTYAHVDPGVVELGAVRGCQPWALGLDVRCELIPVHLGWVTTWVVSPVIMGRECRDGNPGVAELGAVRGSQPQVLGPAVWCELIPVHLGWITTLALHGLVFRKSQSYRPNASPRSCPRHRFSRCRADSGNLLFARAIRLEHGRKLHHFFKYGRFFQFKNCCWHSLGCGCPWQQNLLS